ncbi:thiamine biosynthetic bifunctional enzyme Thi4 [Macrolepiota fuliginosa MF-IS2]|uniref:Thiamine biosynthetic bifunctional enzyme Thi4 n=1 Tax=Macrolepiota fuliginosa MF-IS2 TaxID=1400762 RepID=A0A9P6C9Y6_9AGAR|nr:thiamine biosynthetic bifunctional enzyme Thi4 [Macrolepiota fuliginosa MF-IS2]
MANVDYSIYLVTGRELLPPGKDYLESLEESLQGGVTVVQIREKNADTAEFIEIAKVSKIICDKYNVPILINDRVDVALAINAHGVHLGQTDMSVAQARALLPKGSIIGVSCNNVHHVKKAIGDGVDYIGIGAVWGTKTKNLTSPIIGVRGVGELLAALDGTNIKAVAIGGIKASNLLRTLHGCVSSSEHALDGVAVVSEIVASQTPKPATEKLARIFRAFKAEFSLTPTAAPTTDVILERVGKLMEKVRGLGPLVHQITNNVVATQSANITLALGGSPIMATGPEEMEDLERVTGGLLINIGTLTSTTVEGMRRAGFYANAFRKPLVFDPVGVGATQFRRESVKELLNLYQISVIKGNAGELGAIAGSQEVKARGVDSVGSGFKDPVSFVRQLSRKERCIVVMTGSTDYISDGKTVVSLKNGHEILGKITGSGCIVGSSVATYCAVASAVAAEGGTQSNTEGSLVSGDMLLGAIAGVLVLTVAAEIAVEKEYVHGPGTFLGGLIDVLWSLTPEDVAKRAKITVEVA